MRIHFRNSDSDGGSPLAAARAERRRAELAALFARLKPNVGGETPVVGASWLYKLPVYRRLFPPGYVASALPIQNAFRSMPLWGQFLDRRGELREPRSTSFFDALAQTSRLGDVSKCFPLQALAVSARASQFYDFYEV